MNFDNEKDIIWLKTNNRISLIVFGLYYEVVKNICFYRNTEISYDIFKKVLSNCFIDYLSNIKNKDNYEEILNNFLDEEKAIVTDIAGTTRDIVEGNISLNGVELKLIDTAGIHDTDDYVEKIGVNKSLEKLNNADLVILVLDGSKELDENDNKLLTCIDKTKTIIFVNKSDLPQKINLNLKDNVIYGSAKEVEGLSKLKEKIIDMFNLNEINKDLTYLSNVRQIDLVKKAYLSINNAKNSLSNGIPIEMISTDLKECYEFLGEIIGKTYKDDIIDRLFQDFCVGK